MKSSKSTLAVAVLLSVMSTGAFAAEQADKTYYFDEVVVTASGRPETLFTTKSNTQVITSEQIERMHYTTLNEALRQVSGMQFREYNQTGHEGSSNITINGTNEVLVMIDGVRASMMGSGQAVIKQYINSLDGVERIEVVKGSGSLLYGADAKGGVINIITKKPTSAKTSVGVEGGSFNHETYKISTEGKVNNTSYRVFAEKYHDGNFKDGDGNEWITRKNGNDESIMLSHEFSEGNKLTLNYSRTDEDWGYFDGNLDMSAWGTYSRAGAGGYGTSGYNKGETKSTNFVITLDNKVNNYANNKLVYDYKKYEWGCDGGTIDAYNSGGIFPWGNAYKSKNVKDIFIYTDGNNTVTAGLEYIKSETFTNEYVTSGGGQYLENKSLFVQDDWKFGKAWSLTAGVRYDAPDTGSDNTDMDSRWSKNINLGYKFSEKSNMYVGYNDYLTLPTMSQLYGSNWGTPDLAPVHGKNYEIGFNHKFTPNDVASAHYFYRKSDNMIDYVSTGNYKGYYYNHSDDTKAHGFDVQYDKTFDAHWHAKFGYSRLNSDEETHGYLAKNTFNLGVDYTADKWNFGADVRGYVGRNGSEVVYGSWPKSNYMLVDLSVNYKATKNIKVYAKVNNLFDVYYAEHTGDMPWGWTYGPNTFYGAPGRAFIVGMNWSF